MKNQQKTLNYEPKQIVKDWLIKVYGYLEDGTRLNKLVGVTGLEQLVGIDRANKMLDRAYSSITDACRCKVYGGITVTFYAH